MAFSANRPAHSDAPALPRAAVLDTSELIIRAERGSCPLYIGTEAEIREELGIPDERRFDSVEPFKSGGMTIYIRPDKQYKDARRIRRAGMCLYRATVTRTGDDSWIRAAEALSESMWDSGFQRALKLCLPSSIKSLER